MKTRDFLSHLKTDVDWESDRHRNVEVLENLIAAYGANPSEIANWVRETGIGASLVPLLQHMEYPRPFMDKFVLHIDPQDRFRVRLHRFRPGHTPGLSAQSPTVHNHRWPFSTLILKGGYRETVFDVADITQPPVARSTKELHVGSINSLPAGTFHQTANWKNEQCLTLFIRGRSRHQVSSVWDQGSQTYRRLLGRREQICSEMTAIAKLLTDRELASAAELESAIL